MRKLGQLGQVGPIAVVVAVVAVMITSWIGVQILSNVEQGMPALQPGSYAENAYNSLRRTGWGSYPMLGILVIILVAAAIIGLMVRFGGGA
jgi:uncharacterized membrane protein